MMNISINRGGEYLSRKQIIFASDCITEYIKRDKGGKCCFEGEKIDGKEMICEVTNKGWDISAIIK